MSVYSHSRLSVYEECKLRYRLKYVDRVKRDLEGVEAFLGTRVHESLEAVYRDVMMGRTPGVEEVVERFHRRWDEEWHDEVVVVDGRYSPADHRRVGEESLRRYHRRHAPFRADQTLGVEVKVGVDLPGGSRLEGFADRVARDPDGWLSVHDYKTSSSLPTQEQLDRDRQLGLYQAGVERMWPGAPGVRLVWHFVRFDERLVSTRTREQMAALLADTQQRVYQIESESRWEPHVSRLCDWCPYWDLCPEKKHEWAIRQKGKEEPSLLPSATPAAEDAARALADAVAAMARRGAAEEEYDAARGRILDYSLATGSTRITAPEGTANVRLGDHDALPTSGETNHQRLRAAVLVAGMYDRYADLDLGRLLEDWRAGKLPPELAETVGRLVERRPVNEVRVHPKRP